MFINVATKKYIPTIPRPILAALGLVPSKLSTAKRLETFPTEGLPLDKPVSVRWNQHHVPYIEAETDDDLAFTLGLVHAHLRGAQMNLMRLVVKGRLSELMGPFTKEMDHALRCMDLTVGTKGMWEQMPESTKRWMSRFTDGVNHYQGQQKLRPLELRLLKAPREPWTVDDVLCVGRLMGADFNWLTFLALLPQRKAEGFSLLWRRLLEAGGTLGDNYFDSSPEQELARMVVNAGKAGSNTIAVSAERSESGAAMIGNDPHLGLSLPNTWVLAGLRSPTMNVVGLMLTGLPFVCMGRSPYMAWGGTNLRAASTELFDVSGIPESEIETVETEIKMRGAGTAKRKIRRTPYGTIMSDAPFFPCDKGDMIAFRWVGHQPTDEPTCFLEAGRAKTPEEFRRAFEHYGVPSTAMIYADKAGNIGEIMAATLPVRGPFSEKDFVRDATDPEVDWNGFLGTCELPYSQNPAEGVIVSANTKPQKTSVPVGFFFDSGERFNRLHDLLGRRRQISKDQLEEILCDVNSPTAGKLAKWLGTAIENLQLGEKETAFARELVAWDGTYLAESSGAAAFELLLGHLTPLVSQRGDKAALEHYLSQWNFIVSYFEREFESLATDQKVALMRKALSATLRDLARFPTWGDMHQVKVAHILAKLPLIGEAFVVERLPVHGSRQTPHKTSHGLEKGRHYTDFGSMARHISDMSDDDANWFVMFGGQDGWLGSESFSDQMDLWRERRYMRLPLRPESVPEDFPTAMTLKPNGKPN